MSSFKCIISLEFCEYQLVGDVTLIFDDRIKSNKINANLEKIKEIIPFVHQDNSFICMKAENVSKGTFLHLVGILGELEWILISSQVYVRDIYTIREFYFQKIFDDTLKENIDIVELNKSQKEDLPVTSINKEKIEEIPIARSIQETSLNKNEIDRTTTIASIEIDSKIENLPSSSDAVSTSNIATMEKDSDPSHGGSPSLNKFSGARSSFSITGAGLNKNLLSDGTKSSTRVLPNRNISSVRLTGSPSAKLESINHKSTSSPVAVPNTNITTTAIIEAVGTSAVQTVPITTISVASKTTAVTSTPDVVSKSNSGVVTTASPSAVKATTPSAVKAITPSAVKATTPSAVIAITPSAVKATTTSVKAAVQSDPQLVLSTAQIIPDAKETVILVENTNNQGYQLENVIESEVTSNASIASAKTKIAEPVSLKSDSTISRASKSQSTVTKLHPPPPPPPPPVTPPTPVKDSHSSERSARDPPVITIEENRPKSDSEMLSTPEKMSVRSMANNLAAFQVQKGISVGMPRPSIKPPPPPPAMQRPDPPPRPVTGEKENEEQEESPSTTTPSTTTPSTTTPSTTTPSTTTPSTTSSSTTSSSSSSPAMGTLLSTPALTRVTVTGAGGGMQQRRAGTRRNPKITVTLEAEMLSLPAGSNPIEPAAPPQLPVVAEREREKEGQSEGGELPSKSPDANPDANVKADPIASTNASAARKTAKPLPPPPPPPVTTSSVTPPLSESLSQRTRLNARTPTTALPPPPPPPVPTPPTSSTSSSLSSSPTTPPTAVPPPAPPLNALSSLSFSLSTEGGEEVEEADPGSSIPTPPRSSSPSPVIKERIKSVVVSRWDGRDDGRDDCDNDDSDSSRGARRAPVPSVDITTAFHRRIEPSNPGYYRSPLYHKNIINNNSDNNTSTSKLLSIDEGDLSSGSSRSIDGDTSSRSIPLLDQNNNSFSHHSFLSGTAATTSPPAASGMTDAEYFEMLRKGEEEEKIRKAERESKMDPEALRRLREEEQATRQHESEKITFYMKMKSNFFSSKSQNITKGRTGRGGGRGAGGREES